MKINWRVWHILAMLVSLNFAATCRANPRVDMDLSGDGWRLWQDASANWKDDKLFLPPIDLANVPVNPPSGGWEVLDKSSGVPAAVPGTAEEYLQTIPGPAGDITGITWWYRTVKIAAASQGSCILLRIEAARLRSEIYINHKLVSYDLVGNTPIEADISNAVKPGEDAQIAIRITDPGGNFDWHDKGLIQWGENRLLFGHGFGGVTGRVHLLVCEPVYIEDIYMQNTPAVTECNAVLTISNTTGAPLRRDVNVRVASKNDPSFVVAQQTLKDVQLLPGDNQVTAKISATTAQPWDIDHPNLYVCTAALAEDGNAGDATNQTFGFRWFEATGISKDAMFRLNGKRVVLRGAISWGFFPINGIYATEQLAEKQIRTAKSMGLNMLNFHRCIGQPIILEKADELGLLYYEEPGNYDNGAMNNNPMARGMAHEKVLRMVRRDRSHPSLIIFNMSNETAPRPDAVANYISDMLEMHAIDPTRFITRSSGLRSIVGIENEADNKINLRPLDNTVYHSGWYDDHHAGGPATWTQSDYRDPRNFYHLVNDPQEIIYWGEEGAISTPPRLGLIKADLENAPHLGWDGAMYLDWYKMFDRFIDEKQIRNAFPTVDSLCEAMGNIAMNHQGRKTEVVRINNETDGYVTNGWEAEILENHSGIVDCFRNPKGDPSIMAYYNQPLYVAVMPRNQVVRAGGKVTVDLFLVNEKDVKGPHKLNLVGSDSTGQRFQQNFDVSPIGGDVYGQLLCEGIEIPVSDNGGMFHLEATLIGDDAKIVASGHDDVLVVNWADAKLLGSGALLDNGDRVRQFLEKSKNLNVPIYADDLKKLDWIVAADAPDADSPAAIPIANLRDPTGQKPGLLATYFDDADFSKQAIQRIDESVNLSAPDGAPPDPAVNALSNYSVRWEGQFIPPTSGEYSFFLQATGAARVEVNGEQIESVNENTSRRRRSATSNLQLDVSLEAGKAVAIKIEWVQSTGDANCRLLWHPPTSFAPSAAKILQRVHDDGTTLIVLENAAQWTRLLKNSGASIQYDGSFTVGKTWAGGVHFVKAHPLFKDLPVNGAMDWPYQAVVRNGDSRSGLLLSGEEFAAGAFHANTPLANPPSPIALGTAVGVIPFGKGKVIVSTLDICGNLAAPEGPADVARKLMCNYIEFATAPHR